MRELYACQLTGPVSAHLLAPVIQRQNTLVIGHVGRHLPT